ncbi:hypothetical protein PPERSA_09219 [Pseudocohnilembus persalinus]|uniref:Intraflagellar transport protein 74/72 n=1 Tax=Pseudocohnilembus persalinus TaxID=266149 RepID=A0A0V0R4D7_PSEPJ|nr:hypothetical protein PPERSA_09219 [Pseudocohnilembus persalinus]|eukprot:KRX09335.1 hypothetical protein PPERSA_09219 [Pseudocohnilembus persalinus]
MIKNYLQQVDMIFDRSQEQIDKIMDYKLKNLTEMRLQTGMRNQVGSRMQTGMRDAQFSGIGSGANIKVFNRPVTNHGISGMNVKVNDDRQVVDKAYVINQLKEKISNIINEIDNFKVKTDDMAKNNNLYQNLDKKFEDLTKEVRELEGKLADYNLAFDKQRAGTRPEEIRNMYEHIKIQNDRWRNQLDEIFIERKNQEEQIQQIENQLQDLHELAQQKISELLPEQRQEYENLIQESKDLQVQIQNSRQDLDDINQKVVYCENKLRMDSHKLKGQILREQIEELERKSNDLELQLNEANLPFDQARDRLLNRIKEDNQYITNTEKRIREIRKGIDNYEKRLRELSNESNSQQNSEEQKKKYEAIFEKDKEFTQFFDSYDQLRNKELENLGNIQGNIVNLLEEGSNLLAASGSLPNAADFKNLQSELDFKGNQNAVSSDTLFSMQQEYRQRQEDIKKLQEAEEKVEKEMRSLKEKIPQMKDEIANKYNKIDQQRNNLEKQRKDLNSEKESLSQRRQNLQEDIKKIKYEHDVKEKKLTMNEYYSQYTAAENKVLQMQKDIESLKSFIMNKAKDMDYQAPKEECVIMADELNKQILKNL